jgi:tubulin beta
MGTKIWKVVFGENDIGGDGEYCGDHNAQLDRIGVIYLGASGGKYVPGAVLFDLKRGVIGAAIPSRRSASSSARKIS